MRRFQYTVRTYTDAIVWDMGISTDLTDTIEMLWELAVETINLSQPWQIFDLHQVIIDIKLTPVLNLGSLRQLTK